MASIAASAAAATAASPRQRRGAFAAAEMIINLAHRSSESSSFPLNNYPPLADTAVPGARTPRCHPQWLRPVAEGLSGLQLNCGALGVQVGQAREGGHAAGVSLYAARSFPRGATVGYLWGVLLESEEQWSAIRSASS